MTDSYRLREARRSPGLRSVLSPSAGRRLQGPAGDGGGNLRGGTCCLRPPAAPSLGTGEGQLLASGVSELKPRPSSARTMLGAPGAELSPWGRTRAGRAQDGQGEGVSLGRWVSLTEHWARGHFPAPSGSRGTSGGVSTGQQGAPSPTRPPVPSPQVAAATRCGKRPGRPLLWMPPSDGTLGLTPPLTPAPLCERPGWPNARTQPRS